MTFPTKPQWPSTIAPFIQAIEQCPDFAERLALLVAKLGHKLSAQEATEIAVYTRSLAPGNAKVWALTNASVRQSVANWHAVLLRHDRRNQVYDSAIRADIRPGMTILEIGTGSGILAMMAARAGARHVYTVEIQPALADAARANIARNGFSDKITVINASSLAVKLGIDIPARCDALIQEIISNDLFEQQLAYLVADARERLLKPDPVLIPNRVWASGQLVADPCDWHVTHAGGFDLSAMSLFAPKRQQFNKPSAHPLSRPETLMTLDLAGDLRQQRWRCELTADRSGDLTAILQWIGIGFPDGQAYENPPGTTSCWAPLMHWLRSPRRIAANDRIRLQLDVLDDYMLVIDAAEK